jgi:hypothetical protein
MKNILLAVVIGICITITTYLIHNKCYKKENNKVTMLKLSLLSIVISGITALLVSNTSVPVLSSQDVLTGEPGF